MTLNEAPMAGIVGKPSLRTQACGPKVPLKDDTAMQPLRIGILGFDGLTALDMVGPADAFSSARASERSEERV